MKILVIGSGGREHALVWKLAQSTHATQIWCAPGNPGISTETLSSNGSPAECVAISAEDFQGLLNFATEANPDLTVVGPDNPLAAGIVDAFQERGFKIWGPTKKAARFEGSKAFAQAFMDKYGIPTAKSGVFNDASEAKAFARDLHGRCAVKADGLALGKGVLICTSVDESDTAIDEVLIEKAFGDAGREVVIQELLEGPEVSLHAICDGKTAKLFPVSQDHKRAYDGDKGLNTGGMGAYAPVPFVDDSLYSEMVSTVLDRWLAGCADEDIDFRGLLYPGMMLTETGPKVIEFNARFGDPETQIYLPLLKTDLLDLLIASVDGKLGSIELEWSSETAVCVVMASGGYPQSYETGKPIEGLDDAKELPGVKVFHAGTRFDGTTVVTNGGRVLNVTAVGPDIEAARTTVYEAIKRIRFEGAHFRTDIASQALV